MPPPRIYYFALFYAIYWSLHRIWDTPSQLSVFTESYIQDYLPSDYETAKVSVHEVTKSNDRTLTGLTIFRDGENISPTVYLKPFAEQVAQGRSIEDVLREIAAIQTAHHAHAPMEVPTSIDYEKVRPMLSMKLCDPEINREYLKDKPYTPCGALAVFYRIQIDRNDDGIATAAITNNILQAWGICTEQAYTIPVFSKDF